MRLAERMSRLGTETAFEVLAKAKALEAEGKEIIHLEIGEPDFDTPEHIKEAAIKALQDGKTGYCPAAGIKELREAIAADVGARRGLSVSPDEVVVTPGAKPIMYFVITALVDPGDEVLYPNPGFPIYESVINFVGGKAVPMPLREERNFSFDADEFRSLVTDKTRLIIINSPQNPTGGVLSRHDLEVIAEVATDRDIFVLSDDMTGWRLGYGVMPRELARHVERLTINTVSCTSHFSQYGAIAAITGSQEPVAAMVAEFRRRRDFIVEGLNRIKGVKCVLPKGAFYAFPNITGTGFSSKELERRLLEEAGVATLSGTAFGRYGEGYLRLSYANSLENIRKALDRFAALVA